MISTRILFTPLSVERYDVGEASERLAQRMRDHWQGEALRGNRSDGRRLPSNRKGLPLGIGRGTIVGGRPWIGTWAVRRMQASRAIGATAVEPYQGGRYRIAVAMLRRRRERIVYHTFAGSARKAWRAQLRLEAAEFARSIGGKS